MNIQSIAKDSNEVSSNTTPSKHKIIHITQHIHENQLGTSTPKEKIPIEEAAKLIMINDNYKIQKPKRNANFSLRNNENIRRIFPCINFANKSVNKSKKQIGTNKMLDPHQNQNNYTVQQSGDHQKQIMSSNLQQYFKKTSEKIAQIKLKVENYEKKQKLDINSNACQLPQNNKIAQTQTLMNSNYNALATVPELSILQQRKLIKDFINKKQLNININPTVADKDTKLTLYKLLPNKGYFPRSKRNNMQNNEHPTPLHQISVQQMQNIYKQNNNIAQSIARQNQFYSNYQHSTVSNNLASKEQSQSPRIQKLCLPNSLQDLNQNKPLQQSPNNNSQDDKQTISGTTHKLDSSKCSVRKCGIVQAFTANTNQGVARNYNEDRVSIVINIQNPAKSLTNNQAWPNVQFFGMYDGHGGTKCAEYLRDNLHTFIVSDSNFPMNPKESIVNAFKLAEQKFICQALETKPAFDRSGSCALIVLIVDEMCFVANVGDSRALLSVNRGTHIFPLSQDHRPELASEKTRVLNAGGQIFQSKLLSQNNKNGQVQQLYGPLRVLPGKLSVCRTFGDIECKFKKYGGNPNVTIAIPEIKEFKIEKYFDFIVVGCDGVFEKMSNEQVINNIWLTAQSGQSAVQSLHEYSKILVENSMQNVLESGTSDNITFLLICFKNMKLHYIQERGKLNQNEANSNQCSSSQQAQYYNFDTPINLFIKPQVS